MYISTTALSKSEALRIALRTGYEKLSDIINSAKYATGEVSICDKCNRDDRGFIVSIRKIEKGPKHLTSLQNAFNLYQVRSYATRSGRKKLAPVVELHKDFQILAKHWKTVHQNRSKVFKDLRGLIKLEGI